jgi:DNA modification methylase
MLSESLNSRNQAILTELATSTYEEVAEKYRVSRRKVYTIALAAGARKNEARIRERADERKRRQRETLEAMLNSTATSDVLSFLDSLPDNCAQAVITSPPYNLGKAYGDTAKSDQFKHLFFVGWLYMIVSECARILKPGGSIFLQVGSTKNDQGEMIPLDTILFDPMRQAGLSFQSRVVWTIPHGLTPKNRLAERYETALVFSKGTPTFNPTPARFPQKEPGKRGFRADRESFGKLTSCPLGSFPNNVWSDIGNIGFNHPEKADHPAQFPLKLAKRAVLLYSMPNDLIIDPFSGSGTTHAACIEAGRTFCGADLFYGDVRSQRLANIFPDLVSELPGVTAESIAIWQADAKRVDYAPPGCQTSLF